MIFTDDPTARRLVVLALRLKGWPVDKIAHRLELGEDQVRRDLVYLAKAAADE